MKALFVCLVLSVSSAFALNCGDAVSGNVILTGDLNCVAQSGLFVTASNTIIHLNGHSINCTGTGFAGSCQQPASAPFPPLSVGIFSKNHDHVMIQGPGTINGFGFGIELDGGAGHLVTQVTVTGPSVPLAQNQRGQNAGIWLRNIDCRFSPLAPSRAVSATVSFNQVSNQLSGILGGGQLCARLRESDGE